MPEPDPSRPPDPTDLFAVLRADHDRIAVLLEQLVAAAPTPAQLHHTLLVLVRRELELHGPLEEEYLYPELAHVPATREAAHHAEQQHGAHLVLLRELTALPLGAQQWLPTLERLQAVLQTHFALEENELFPLARRHLSQDRAADLGRRAARDRMQHG